MSRYLSFFLQKPPSLREFSGFLEAQLVTGLFWGEMADSKEEMQANYRGGGRSHLYHSFGYRLRRKENNDFSRARFQELWKLNLIIIKITSLSKRNFMVPSAKGTQSKWYSEFLMNTYCVAGLLISNATLVIDERNGTSILSAHPQVSTGPWLLVVINSLKT